MTDPGNEMPFSARRRGREIAVSMLRTDLGAENLDADSQLHHINLNDDFLNELKSSDSDTVFAAAWAWYMMCQRAIGWATQATGMEPMRIVDDLANFVEPRDPDSTPPAD